MNGFVGSASLSLPDRKVLMQPALPRDKVDVVSASTNEDAGGPRTTMLRPGNILVQGASDKKWYDDTSGGQASAPAYVLSSEAPDADWASTTITLHIDGVSGVAVALGAGDDTIAEVVTALNAAEEFAALAVAADNGADDLLKITLRDPGAHLKVTSSLATAFGASGQSAFPTEADIVVTMEHCDQLNPMGSVADARVSAVRAGVFDESQLLYAGAAATSSASWPDFKRILKSRGSRFE